MLGAAGALALALLTGFIAPALPEPGNGVYSSKLPLTQAGLDGRAVYRSLGCASCHTQQVRPLAIDAGLGGVTISDSNQELGSRRYGPDLSAVGARITDPNRFSAILQGANGHPAYTGLRDADVQNLIAYLSTATATSQGTTGTTIESTAS
jgi:mono/diheme cytochrome c family protein